MNTADQRNSCRAPPTLPRRPRITNLDDLSRSLHQLGRQPTKGTPPMERNTNQPKHDESAKTGNAETAKATTGAEARITPTEATETGPRRLCPRIYAACLAAYNSEVFHGEWIDADQAPDDLMLEIWQMLGQSPIEDAEEWAIHDYEDFGAFKLHEYERVETIARIAGGLALHGPAFAHWIHEVGSEAADSIETFENAYRGTYNSYSDIAKQFLDDMGFNPETILPDWITPYVSIDWDGLGRAVVADQIAVDDRDGVHVFEAS